jgi:hypothetical protein
VVKITPQDIDAFNRAFAPGNGVMFVHGRGEVLELSIVTEEAAKVLIEHDLTLRGHA